MIILGTASFGQPVASAKIFTPYDTEWLSLKAKGYRPRYKYESNIFVLGDN